MFIVCFTVDLFVGVVDLQIGHGSKIDWLELNETGHKLLYRDKNATLTLLDARTGHKEILLNGCTFVQVRTVFIFFKNKNDPNSIIYRILFCHFRFTRFFFSNNLPLIALSCTAECFAIIESLKLIYTLQSNRFLLTQFPLTISILQFFLCQRLILAFYKSETYFYPLEICFGLWNRIFLSSWSHRFLQRNLWPKLQHLTSFSYPDSLVRFQPQTQILYQTIMI